MKRTTEGKVRKGGGGWRQRERESQPARQTETERDTNRQTDRQAQIQTERQRSEKEREERKTEKRERERKIRQREKESKRERERERDREYTSEMGTPTNKSCRSARTSTNHRASVQVMGQAVVTAVPGPARRQQRMIRCRGMHVTRTITWTALPFWAVTALNGLLRGG